MLSCFGDESSDESKQRVFVVAAVIGNDDQWNRLEPQWKGRTGSIPFHATDCDTDQGDYRSRSHSENKALYKDVITLLAESGLVGFGFAIDLIAQNKVFPNAPDFVYYKGFLEVLDRMYNLCVKHNETVKFTFDTRLNTDHNAGLLYGQVIEAMPQWKERFFPEIGFVSSRTHWRIQVADLMARESMKLLDNMIGPVKRPPRKSYLALSAVDRFLTDVVTIEWFEDLKQKMPEAMKLYGMEEFKYHEWLRARNRQDSMTNLLIWMHSTAMDGNA
jgi:hypothetical protein